jgi:hypothetical protein
MLACARAYKYWHAQAHTSFGILTRIQILEIFYILWKVFQNCAQAHTNFGMRTRTQILEIFRKFFKIVRTRILIMACGRAYKFWHAHAHTNFGMRTLIQIFQNCIENFSKFIKIFENCGNFSKFYGNF